MGTILFEKIAPKDAISKRERVELTLDLQPIDRVAILEQLSFNPTVIARYTGKIVKDYDYTWDDICHVIRRTLDLTMPPHPPHGTDRVTTDDGFIMQYDNWTAWHVARPFTEQVGARDWLRQRTKKTKQVRFESSQVREDYRKDMTLLQQRIGDTVILGFSNTGMCSVFTAMGLEIFTYFYADYPEVMYEFMEAYVDKELRRIHAVADRRLSPVILIPEDFATKQGPIFPPTFLQEYHYPYVTKLTEAWHDHGIKVLYHSDGNWRKAIPDLINCGVDGFYCLEPGCSMDIVELKNAYPEHVWSGGLDGVDLMERGTPEQVKTEVKRHIRRTDALQTGGMFVASSSEINPPVRVENFEAMIAAVCEASNSDFHR